MISVLHMIIFGHLYLDFTTWESNSSFTLTCLALHSLLLLDIALVLFALLMLKSQQNYYYYHLFLLHI